MMNSELITLIITSGSIGMIHYWILREFEVLNFFNHKNKDEKFSLLVILTVINFYAYQVIKITTHNICPPWTYYILSFLFALIAEGVLFSLLKFILKKANFKKEENNKGYSFQVSSLRKVIEDNLISEVFVVIFDFEDKLIASGYLESYPTDLDEQNYVLKNIGTIVESDYNIFKENLNPETNIKIYISTKEKTKMYLFFD